MHSRLRHAVAALAAIAATSCTGALLVAGCSTPKDATNSQSQALIEAGITGVVPKFSDSPSAVASRRTLVVGYNDHGTAAGISPSNAGWATSFNGLIWTPCNMIDTGVFANCNQGPARLAPRQTQWVAPPSLVADGRGNVVYVTLGTTLEDDVNFNPPSLVVATVSNNDGHTFGKQPGSTVVVNNGACAGGIQDLPNAAFDFTTEPPTLWVVWRNKSQSSFGGCVRRGQLVQPSQGVFIVQWLDDTHVVSAMDKDKGDIFMGQGGLRVQAGDGVVAVAYSNNDRIAVCPDPSRASMTWSTVTSFDNGASWHTRSAIAHTSEFQGCTMGARIQNSIRAFDFLRAPDGNYYFVVNDTKQSIRLFMSGGSGTLSTFLPGQPVWREYCRHTTTFDGTLDAGTPPLANWTVPGVPCEHPFQRTAPKTSSLFMPTLGVDGNGRVSVSFFRTMDDKHVRAEFWANVAPRSATSIWQGPQPLGFQMQPNPDAGAALSGVLGSTMCVLGRTPPSSESCSSAGPFFPFWPQIPRLDTLPAVETEQIAVE